MTNMLEGTHLVVLFLPIVACASAQPCGSEKKPLDSMRYSCDAKAVLSVSVSTPRRENVPKTEINLTDPGSRQQGENPTSAIIPRSRYEIIAEIPNLPKKSTQRAVEICGAESGDYLLTILEHADENYRITVEATTEEDAVALPEKLRSHEGQIREFKFRFKTEKGKIYLTWLDDNGQPQTPCREQRLVSGGRVRPPFA